MRRFDEIIQQDKFEVSDLHIENGECNNPDKCPITLSLNELAIYHYDFSVFDYRVRFAVPRAGKHYDYYDHVYMSDRLQQWVEDFDNGNHVEPITVYVDLSNPMCLYLEGETRSYMKLWPKGF